MLSMDFLNSKLLLFSFLAILAVWVWGFMNRKGWLSYANTKANQNILSKCPTIRKNVFIPTIYLQHKLLQTIFSSLLNPTTSNATFIMEKINLKGGGHTSLAWVQDTKKSSKDSNRSKVLVVVIPGLTGSCKDNYIKDLVGLLCKIGYRCVVYHSRFNEEKIILPNEGYMDIIGDFKQTMEYIITNEKNVKMFGIGHSYGANLLVNYLGTYNTNNPFIGGISLANPYNLILGENQMRGSLVNRPLTSFLQKTVEGSRKELTDAIRFNLNMEEMLRFSTVRDFDRNFTIKVYGYDTVEDFYWGVSSCRQIKNVKVPLLMIQAEDDPIAESKGFVKEEIEKSNPNVILMMTTKGGHQGWIEGFFRLRRWYLQPTLEFVNAIIDSANL